MSTKFHRTLVVVLAVAAAGMAQAQPTQRIEKLPMVVVTGKAQPAPVRVAVQQLPRVVIEGRSQGVQQRLLAAAKPLHAGI